MAENKRAIEVLRARSDFARLSAKGLRSSPRRWITFFSLENSLGRPRVGFTLSRKVGPAVLRNRLRRRGREYFRRASGEGWQMGVDINVVFRPMEPEFYKKLDSTQFREAFDQALRMVGERHSKSRTSHD